MDQTAKVIFVDIIGHDKNYEGDIFEQSDMGRESEAGTLIFQTTGQQNPIRIDR